MPVRTQAASLVEQPELVKDFLELVSRELRPLADEEYQVMREMKRRMHSSKPLEMWDVPYFSGVAKRCVMSGGSTNAGDLVRNSFLSQYFPLGSVMKGFCSLVHCLFGVTLSICQPENGELWACDVHKLAVTDSDESLLGHIYCDLIQRSGKPYQDCHFTIRGGKEDIDGSYQNPIVVVHLCLPPGKANSPPLLTPHMVENLFHEMGHAMHSMLARTRYQHVTGTRCSTDFAEVPSILMEMFAMDPRVLRTFAFHYKTNEPIPSTLLQALIKSKSIFAASDLQTQVYYSAVDQRYHGTDPFSGGASTTDVLIQEHNKHYSLPFVENTAWQLRFNHFVGYGGKYYSYLVSRTVASWIWKKYFEENPFSRESGNMYREKVLRHGGGVPPRQLVGDFLSKEITATSLAEAIIADIYSKRELVAL